MSLGGQRSAGPAREIHPTAGEEEVGLAPRDISSLFFFVCFGFTHLPEGGQDEFSLMNKTCREVSCLHKDLANNFPCGSAVLLLQESGLATGFQRP